MAAGASVSLEVSSLMMMSLLLVPTGRVERERLVSSCGLRTPAIMVLLGWDR